MTNEPARYAWEEDTDAAIRNLYSRHPEYFHHEPWELQHVLFSLGYVDDLAVAVDVAREDYPQWKSAA